MHRQSGFVFSIALLAAAAAPVWAQDTMQSMPPVGEAALARAQEKFARALRVVDQFNDQARARGIDGDGWRFQMLANLMRGSEANIAAVGTARTFAEAMSASGRGAPIGTLPPDARPMSLGDALDDLVYVPIVPCRILDTRGHGGPLAAGSSQDYYYTPANPGSANCDVTGQIPGGAVSPTPAAIAVNVTVDDTGFSGGFSPGSYLRLFPQGASTPASFLNFGPGQVVANAGIVKIDLLSQQFTVYASAPAQVIVDLYGVFITPQATELDCSGGQQKSGTLPANGSVAFASASCQAGYALTGGACTGGDATTTYLTKSTIGGTGHEWLCGWISKNASAQTVYASPRCCRVPGR
jgi:hypothetical protein